MTRLSDALIIVPAEDLWVSVSEELFEPVMASLDWNDMLSTYGITLPADQVKIGMLDGVLRKGKICRPIKAYIDFNNDPITVVKGY